MINAVTIIGLLASWLAATPVQAQSPQTQSLFVLNSGGVIAGYIIHATRNTLTIRRDIGGIQQVTRDRLVRVDVIFQDGTEIEGSFAGWKDGRTGIETNGQRIWFEGGRIVEREPLESARPNVARRAARQQSKVAVSPIAAPTAPSKVAAAEAATNPASRKDNTPSGALQTSNIPVARAAAVGGSSPKPKNEGTKVPTLSVVPSAVKTVEGAGEVTFTLEFSQPSEKAIGVVYATVDGEAVAGEDYTTQEGVLTLPPGTMRHVVRAGLIDDGQREADETFHLFVSARPEVATVINRWTSILIRDDD